MIVIPASVFLGLGRIANFINGEIPGTLTSVPWAVKFPNIEGCRHPIQLYLALKNFVQAGFLYWLSLKKNLKRGVLTWAFVLFYGVTRFIIDFWREELRWLGISMGQYLCLAMIVVAVYFLCRILKGKEITEGNKAQSN